MSSPRCRRLSRRCRHCPPSLWVEYLFLCHYLHHSVFYSVQVNHAAMPSPYSGPSSPVTRSRFYTNPQFVSFCHCLIYDIFLMISVLAVYPMILQRSLIFEVYEGHTYVQHIKEHCQADRVKFPLPSIHVSTKLG